MRSEDKARAKQAEKTRPLEEGPDYYLENGLMVLTARFLLERGYCCGNDCRHCPYTAEEPEDSQ